ncbi:MAG: MarR family transcriptional regulator [Dehalococcoidia bacterium]|nr:MarR family transcriptional regulator [Dehalococcoidia bacterium]
MTDFASVPPYSRQALIEAIPQRILHMLQASSQLGPEPWLDLDLTMKQLKVLMVLCSLGPTRPSVIASCIGGSAANATGVLDRLEAQGYVERRPDTADRRALLVGLTDSGQTTVDRLHSAGQERLSRALVGMAGPDLEALHQGLAALVEATQNLAPDFEELVQHRAPARARR